VITSNRIYGGNVFRFDNIHIRPKCGDGGSVEEQPPLSSSEGTRRRRRGRRGRRRLVVIHLPLVTPPPPRTNNKRLPSERASPFDIRIKRVAKAK